MGLNQGQGDALKAVIPGGRLEGEGGADLPGPCRAHGPGPVRGVKDVWGIPRGER